MTLIEYTTNLHLESFLVEFDNIPAMGSQTKVVKLDRGGHFVGASMVDLEPTDDRLGSVYIDEPLLYSQTLTEITLKVDSRAPMPQTCACSFLIWFNR